MEISNYIVFLIREYTDTRTFKRSQQTLCWLSRYLVYMILKCICKKPHNANCHIFHRYMSNKSYRLSFAKLVNWLAQRYLSFLFAANSICYWKTRHFKRALRCLEDFYFSFLSRPGFCTFGSQIYRRLQWNNKKLLGIEESLVKI